MAKPDSVPVRNSGEGCGRRGVRPDVDMERVSDGPAKTDGPAGVDARGGHDDRLQKPSVETGTGTARVQADLDRQPSQVRDDHGERLGQWPRGGFAADVDEGLLQRLPQTDRVAFCGGAGQLERGV